MAEVHKIAGGFTVSIATIAAEFSMGRDTVAKRLDRAGLVPVDTKHGHPVYRLRDATKAILGVPLDAKEMPRDPDGGERDPSSLPPAERRAWYQSESERLKVEAAKRELLPAEEFEREMASALKLVVQALETLGDRLERDCALAPSVIERVNAIAAEVRGELHRDLSAIADE